jgi:hypothetical protein
MTDEDVEKIIKRNMNLQMNIAGIRADFEAAQQRTWIGLTPEEMRECNYDGDIMIDRETAKLNVQAKLREKNT